MKPGHQKSHSACKRNICYIYLGPCIIIYKVGKRDSETKCTKVGWCQSTWGWCNMFTIELFWTNLFYSFPSITYSLDLSDNSITGLYSFFSFQSKRLKFKFSTCLKVIFRDTYIPKPICKIHSLRYFSLALNNLTGTRLQSKHSRQFKLQLYQKWHGCFRKQHQLH